MAPRKPPTAKKSGADQTEKIIGDLVAGKASSAQYGTFAAIVVGILAVAGGVMFVMRSRVVALSPTDTASLKEVFYSGEPWLVECTKARQASPVVYDAESSLDGFKVGTLNCAEVLPSGKTTYERFKLKEPSYGPVLLAMANGAVPQLAPRNVLSNPLELAKWAKGATPPKVYSPATSEQFESQCLKKAWCVVVLSPTGRLVDAERAALQRLAAAERRVRIVKVDEAKATLLLDLPGGVPPPTASEAVLLLLKQLPRAGKAAAADAEEDAADEAPPVAATRLVGGLRDMSASQGAIAAALKADAEVPEGFSTLVKRPALLPKRLPSPSTPRAEQATASRSSPPEPAAKTLTDAELKASSHEIFHEISHELS